MNNLWTSISAFFLKIICENFLVKYVVFDLLWLYLPFNWAIYYFRIWWMEYALSKEKHIFSKYGGSWFKPNTPLTYIIDQYDLKKWLPMFFECQYIYVHLMFSCYTYLHLMLENLTFTLNVSILVRGSIKLNVRASNIFQMKIILFLTLNQLYTWLYSLKGISAKPNTIIQMTL